MRRAWQWPVDLEPDEFAGQPDDLDEADLLDIEVQAELAQLRAEDADRDAAEGRTEAAALTALITALLGLVLPAVLGLPTVIMSHWAVRGSKRDVALVLGWIEIVVVVVVVAVLLMRIQAAASGAG